MQFNFWRRPAVGASGPGGLEVNGRVLRLLFVRNPRARRYVLRLRPDGTARVTIPRGGSAGEAQHFAERHREWLAQQLLRQAAQPASHREWRFGTEIHFRGELARLEPAGLTVPAVRLGGEVFQVGQLTSDLRPALERELWRLAACELPARLAELATRHGFTVARVSVRNQRSRWGSCSRRGTISLNWRLLQTPDFVRDYICLHELAHLRHMNHSPRYWREVEQLCPDYQRAEAWLRQHSSLLR